MTQMDEYRAADGELTAAAQEQAEHPAENGTAPALQETEAPSEVSSEEDEASPKTEKKFDVSELKAELKREKHKKRYGVVLRSTIYALVTVAAVAVLVATLWMPVLQIYGTSMKPTLKENEIVLSLKGSKFEQGDIVAFYYGNKLLVKRVIAGPSDWVDIDADGNVSVNGKLLDEPYIKEKALGTCDIEFPYQVPEEKYFVMGDNRPVSSDSRSKEVGCIGREQIVGRVGFRIWPLKKLGKLK